MSIFDARLSVTHTTPKQLVKILLSKNIISYLTIINSKKKYWLCLWRAVA